MFSLKIRFFVLLGAVGLLACEDQGDNSLQSKSKESTNILSVQVPGNPQNFMALAGDGFVQLKWHVPTNDQDEEDSTITRYQYRVKLNDSTTWSPDWTNIPDGDDSDAEEENETQFTVKELTNGLLYSFQVRAVNDNGMGSEATVTSTPNPPGSKAWRLTVSTSSSSVTEGDEILLTISTNGVTYEENQVIVVYVVSEEAREGEDWILSDKELTLSPGATQVTTTLTIVDDKTVEKKESFQLYAEYKE